MANRGKPSARDVINDQLTLARQLYPGYLMAGSVINALEDAGYVVLDRDQFDDEIALAHSAGFQEGAESVGSPG